ncbi:MAG TPA: ABC transporter ATP-binding protein [Gemmatimonadales bacterium]|nr:ABC transporter ATP-binding protein [Gemmatimonadales bacterium]
MARERGLTSLRQVRAMLVPHAVGEVPALAMGAVLGVSVVLFQVLLPWPLKWILDFLAGARAPSKVVDWVARVPGDGLLALSGAFVVLALASAAAEYGQSMVLNGAGNRIVSRFRTTLFGHILRQPLSFHERQDVGELLTRVVYDTSRLRRGLNGFLIQIVQTIALFLTTLTVLSWHNWAMGLALGIGGLLTLFAMQQRGRRIARAAKKQRRKEGSLAALIAEELRSIRELQTFGLAGSALLARFGDRNFKSLRQEQKVRRLAAGLSFRVEAILAVSVGLAVVLGIKAVNAGDLSAGDLWLFVSYTAALRSPFSGFARQAARLGRTYACSERLAILAGREPEIVDGAVQLNGLLRGELSFYAVSAKAPTRARGGRKWTLHELSCRLPAGKRIAVVGPNGAGKSTLLRLALRLADPASGRVLLDDRDLRVYTIESLRRQMSVVFQDSILAGLSVRENIAFGLLRVSEQSVKSAAVAARAHHFIQGLPQGYETKVRRGGDLFSGGERQRLAVARAILRGGRVWLLDEPTAGLDHATTRELEEVLLELTRGRTTLWVTHDQDLVSRLDWVLALDQGRAAFDGPPGAYRAWLTESSKTPTVA